MSPNENIRRAQALRVLSGMVPAGGTNTPALGHTPNIMDASWKGEMATG